MPNRSDIENENESVEVFPRRDSNFATEIESGTKQ